MYMSVKEKKIKELEDRIAFLEAYIKSVEKSSRTISKQPKKEEFKQKIIKK